MGVRLIHDPIADALRVVNDLYPNLDVRVTYYSKDPNKYNWGFAAWMQDGNREVPAILLNSRAPYKEMTDVLLHEVAHIIVGIGHGHDEVWEQTRTALWTELFERYNLRFGKIRKGLCTYSPEELERRRKNARDYASDVAQGKELKGRWLQDTPMTVVPMRFYR